MEDAQSLPILTWAVLLGPMPMVVVLAAARYFKTRRHRQRRNGE